MKNPNGFGTVYKMSGKRRNKWRAVKTVGWDENGKQKRVTIGYFFEKKDGMDALAKYVYNPNAKLTIKDVYEMWNKTHFTKVSENSKRSIDSRYRTHISKIEDMHISEIKLQHLQDFFNDIKSSSNTMLSIKAVLNMIFEYAVKNDFITKNIVKYVEFGKHKNVYEKKEFTEEEIQILWNNIDVPYVDTLLILIYTGMRVMEMLNLKVKDIDIKKKYIFISKSKTSSGIRHIPIHNKILPLIIRRMENQEYLISYKNKPYTYQTYKRNFIDTLQYLGIQRHTPHECRHTTATLLSNAGANQISIAKIMGHTDYKMTAAMYTHKSENELQKAMSSLN